MAVHWRKFLLKINEFYFKEKKRIPKKRADVHIYFEKERLNHAVNPFTIHLQGLHLCIDLRKSEKTLLKEMNRTTRYKINRAKKDNFEVLFITEPKQEDIEDFVSFYNSFAKTKKIPLCNKNKLEALNKRRMINITSVFSEHGIKLVSHATIMSEGRAISLYAGSARFNCQDISGQLFSRADRYLHWCEIKLFKKMNLHTFDFMGLSIDPEDINLQNLNAFKRGFGGEELITYKSFIPKH